MSNLPKNLLVFTNPTQEIVFYADDQTSHKQVLTIMNNFQFPLNIQITISDESKYSLSEHHKLIEQNYYAEIIVHHKSITSSNLGISDTLKISSYNKVKNVRGSKELPLKLLATRPCSCKRTDMPSTSMDSELPFPLQRVPRELQYPAQERRRDVVVADVRRDVAATDVRRDGSFDAKKFISVFLSGVICCYLFRSPPGGFLDSEFLTKIQELFLAFISGILLCIWKFA